MRIWNFQDRLWESIKVNSYSSPEIEVVDNANLYKVWTQIAPKPGSRKKGIRKKQTDNGASVKGTPDYFQLETPLGQIWDFLNSYCFVKKISPIYGGHYCVELPSYNKKVYTPAQRENGNIEKKAIARSTIYLAYSLYYESQSCGEYGSTLSKFIELCMREVYVDPTTEIKSFYDGVVKNICDCAKKGTSSSGDAGWFVELLENDKSCLILYALTIAATQLCCKRDVERDNYESIKWFFSLDDSIPNISEERMISNSDYAFVEEQIIRHIWTTNRLIFDNHSLVARRGGIILSDYYVVPALSCLNDKSCEFILDRTDGIPIRARLCAPSGFGKSTLFLAIIYCATLDKAVEYGVISSEEERNYRALQKELIGGDKSFPQFLPVVITGSEFSKRRSGDFIDLFAQMIFPTDDHTPEHEIEDKKKWQNVLREMIESHADQVLFFCDAFDECDSKYRARYGEKFRMISEHPNGYNILLSYRPLCDEGLIHWKECTQWTILPLSSWGIDKGTNKDKTWLMIRKTTDSICIFDKDESEHYTNLIYDRMNTFPVLKEFSVSPYLMSEYVSLCVTSKGEYLEKTVYEMIRDMVSRIFARFNFNDRELNGEKFKEICGGIALNQIQKDPYAIILQNLSDIFCNVVNKKYPDEDILKYFSTMIACEDINSKSGVLILNNDHSGYVFQANAITMPYLASLEMFSIIYKIVQDAKDFSESNEDTERKIMYELRQVLEWIHKDHYIFIPLLIARICDRSSGPNISPRHNQQKKICQLILDCANSLDIPDKMDTLRDRSFAKTVFCD